MLELKKEVESTDKKLVGALHLFKRIKDEILGKYDSFSFLGILRILLKFCVTRPICLINRPHESRQLVETIAELIMNMRSFRDFITLNRLLTEDTISPPKESAANLGEDEAEEINQEPE